MVRLVQALEQAASYGHVDVVCYLFEHGVDASALTSAFRLAVECCEILVAEYLIDKSGVDVLTIDIDEFSPLTYACRNQFVDMVRLLAARGADVNAVDSTGFLPLQIGLLHLDLVEILLEAGADPDVHFNDGSTALLDVVVSTCHQNQDLLLLLLQHGADPNLAHAHTGNTPLMAAALHMHIDLVELLLEYKADVTQVDFDGISVLDKCGDDLVFVGYVELCMQYVDSNRSGAKPLLK